jgi:hypothetical protein
MPFLVLNKNSEPLVDPATGLICHFDSRDEAEAFRKQTKGARVMEIPVLTP